MPRRHSGPIAVMLAAFGLAALLAAAPALAQTASTPAPSGGLEAPIGKVLSVSGAVTIEHAVAVILQANLPGGVTQAKTGDFVFRGDMVQTRADGKLSLIFSDGSAFNLSNNGRMVLDSFVFDPNSQSNSSSDEPDQGKCDLRLRSGCQNRRHEGRHARRHNGNSRHHAPD